MSSDYPQALRAPIVTASTVKIGEVVVNAAETELITTQSSALYLESVSVVFYDSGGAEVPTGTLKIYLDVTAQSIPTLTLTPSDVRTKYKIADLGNFQIKSQSPGGITIEPVNPYATTFLRVTGQGVSSGDTVSRIITWRA